LANNLSSRGTFLCYVSRNEREQRNEVHIVKESADDIYNEKHATIQTIMLPDRAGQPSDTISQARFIRMAGMGDLLVVITHTGLVNLYDDTGQKLLAFHKLARTSPPGPVAKELLLSGISNDNARLFIGAATGEVLVFNVSKQKFVLTKKHPGHKDAISDLAYVETAPNSQTGILISGDQSGSLALWDDSKEVLTRTVELPGPNTPITSIRCGHGYAVISFASGLIRLLDLKLRKYVVELTAHARSIIAVDVHPTRPIFAATSEDTYTSIWTFPVNKKIKNIFCGSLGHSLFTGLQFCGKSGGTTATPSAPGSTALSTTNVFCVMGLDSKFLQFLPLPSE